MISVLVAAPDQVVRAGIAALLGAADGVDVVAEAGSATGAVAGVAAHRPEVAVVDGGFDLRGVSRVADGATRVIALVDDRSDEAVCRALRAGASGVVERAASADALVHAVCTVATGGLLLGEDFVRRLVEAYRPRAQDVLAERLARLTAREAEVLGMVGFGLRNAEIARRLVISESTVKTHLNRAMAKLDVSSRAQVVVVAYECGLVVPGQHFLNEL
ncbi:DNA-binding NarL/FixJ family response regulator [Saccharothrix tamanrassetensis]|uniref:DNA-binding NarL/FixJ family response regulator n=1 Tax=Saccharothrix tamanrassetensis TaxID=1051531 RepID=A0A841CP43_9PSEU|nr:response regulator transcription factor [Saccharothrix tamanrassetensis]MBB5959069.1 DNA-binding NarL/FixJ family response regulator [Saccharothrix tamanrassetensis]